MIQGYDNWKLDCPRELDWELEPVQEAVGMEHGIFAWQVFCQTQRQNMVSGWAWETCKKGPFTTLGSKLLFWLRLAEAKLKNLDLPIQAASLKCVDNIDQDYLDACTEIENTWFDPFFYSSTRPVQESDFAINFYIYEAT